ncbi:MAG TPA: hypothetical protein DCE44_18090, partial [Verrucomicrobiales bacterium]|nr:hypothetical protein [Verrucomicrobiales bacterium]
MSLVYSRREGIGYPGDPRWLRGVLETEAPIAPTSTQVNRFRSLMFGLLLALLLAGCASSNPKTEKQFGESVVFIGEVPASLAVLPLNHQPLQVRSAFRRQSNTVTYVEGRDYVVDWSAGTLRRTSDSRLPEFRTNVLFGAENFDHSKYPGFGNTAFFAFVDYEHTPGPPWPIQPNQTQLLPRSDARLTHGGPFKIVAFGDSITAGGDATSSELIFWKRWTDYLQRRYPAAEITAINGATGGDSTVQGLQRLADKVLAQQPDLVLVGFGMNDHNRGGVPVAQFAANLRTIVQRIRAETSAEVVLFSAFPPNPKWAFGSHHMEDYATATAQVAAETGCAYADVFTNWQAVAARKKPEDLLGNDI